MRTTTPTTNHPHLPSKRPATALVTLILGLLFALTGAPVAGAAPVPSTLLLTSHIGWEVDATTGGNICTFASKNTCQPGKETSEPGGFLYPESVAVNNDPSSPSYEHVYVLDSQNHRVQELTATGVFVSVFGWDVNKTKVEDSVASQAERNICTAVSKDVCQAGVEGTASGQFSPAPSGIAVDPVSGDVYVAEYAFESVGEELEVTQRVQKFTATGTFALEIGKEVNTSTHGNLCTAGEACQAAALRPIPTAEGDSEPGSFSFEFGVGGLLAVGGPEDLLYVGDHARIQKFHANGTPAGTVPLTGISETGKTKAVAVDPAGDVFVVDTEAPGVYEYSPAGALEPQVVDPGSFGIRDIAIDSHSRLALISEEPRVHGVLYDTTGAKLSEFAPASGEMPRPVSALAFSATGQLYVDDLSPFELEAYTAVVFPQAHTCAASEVTGTSAKLCGEVNPDGVQASGFFQYGTSASLGSLTPTVFEGAGEAFAPLTTQLTGLVPNQAYQYRVAVEAEAGGEKLQGHGENMAFHTPGVAPQIPGQPSATFIGDQSAVLNAVVNPEHATTRYHYEYGACPTLAGCTGVHSTSEETSAVYGAIGFTAELDGLAPSTTYSYRLLADNEYEEGGQTLGGKATGAEGTFTTAAAPVPNVQTGAYGALTPTSATIAGTVDPEGVPVSYAFELGVYEGAGTQYGIVASGSPTTGNTPVEENTALSGLQPGTTYAYRLVIHSGQGEARGTTATFTTPGLPSVLASPTSPPMLATPNVAFPAEAKPTVVKKTTKCAGGKKLRNGKCLKSKPRKKSKHGKKK